MVGTLGYVVAAGGLPADVVYFGSAVVGGIGFAAFATFAFSVIGVDECKLRKAEETA